MREAREVHWAREVRGASRGQLSFPLIEAAVGVLLVLGVACGFAIGAPHPDGSEKQVSLYASDAATLLAAGTAGNATAFDAGDGGTEETGRTAVREAIDAALPANCMYRATTPWGTVGYPRPPGVTVGTATAPSAAGPITVEVWDA